MTRYRANSERENAKRRAYYVIHRELELEKRRARRLADLEAAREYDREVARRRRAAVREAQNGGQSGSAP